MKKPLLFVYVKYRKVCLGLTALFIAWLCYKFDVLRILGEVLYYLFYDVIRSFREKLDFYEWAAFIFV